LIGQTLVNETSFLAELKNVFLIECEEMTDKLERAMMQLEKDPQDFSKIDLIFRFVHTIKGSAAMADFPNLVAFVHGFETLLATIKDQKPKITTQIIDVLLKGNDTLKLFTEALKDDVDADIPTHETTSVIKACLAAISPPPKTTAQEPNGVTRPDSTLGLEPMHGLGAAEYSSIPTFLICDDEADILALIADFLREIGYNTVTALNVKDALELFHTHSIQGIFTDYMMPGLSGTDFVAAIRRKNEFVPIVVISGHTGKEQFKDYIKLGVLDFLEKPLNFGDISNAANQMLRYSELQKALFGIARISLKLTVSIERLLTFATLSPLGLEEKERLLGILVDLHLATTNLRNAELNRK
jgi:DNA-binding response OmpR family regulator/HPt (histidine-containing phosphotransfer) domain-containing protein